MTDDDKISLTRSQFDSWFKNDPRGNVTFDSLKAHVSKKERREYWIDQDDYDAGWSRDSFNDNCIKVREVLPGDRTMNDEEMREWVKGAFNKAFPISNTNSLSDLLKALGLSEGK